MLHAYRDIHRENIKEYKMELQNAALEENRGQKTGEINSQPGKENGDKTRDKNKDRDWTHSR